MRAHIKPYQSINPASLFVAIQYIISSFPPPNTKNHNELPVLEKVGVEVSTSRDVPGHVCEYNL